jgi:hypothetical protein
MKNGMTIQCKVKFNAGRSGRKQLQVQQDAPTDPELRPVGRIPRIAKLMALAIRFDTLIQSGQVNDYAELARLGHVTRARVTQIMNLLNLAPDIQEQLLFLPVSGGRDPIKEWQVRPVAAEQSWAEQRRLWQQCFLHC